MKTAFPLKIHFGPGILPVLIAGLMWMGATLPAQDTGLSRAHELAAAGSHAQAEQLYNRILHTYPDDDEALLGRAVVRSWKGSYAAAEADFTAFLKKNPDRLDAWAGYGFSLGWARNYPKAERIFRELLNKAPDLVDARKGLAYVALWRGDGPEAMAAFRALSKDYPGEAEYTLALGQACLLTGQQRAAREAFQSVLKQYPGHPEAKALLASVRMQPAYVEVEGWAGYSRLQQTDKAGLRALSLAWQPRHDLRFWLRYDNSLSLDNLSLIQNRQLAPAWYAGGLVSWSHSLATRMEVGRRVLPEQGTQILLQGEQVFYLDKGLALKAGASFGPVAGKGSDLLLYAGGKIPLSPILALEPHYYFASSSLQHSTEHRVLLNAQAQLCKGHRLLAGLMVGRVNNENPSLSGNLGGGNLIWAFPLAQLHEFQVLARYEKGAQESFVTLAAGLKIRIER